ncbi:MAG: hypothetical protein IT379_06185, partial [Deltaproteobacteria bacterium]|nr:hypothetical protein [Deltaproteobacteria bacterium]
MSNRAARLCLAFSLLTSCGDDDGPASSDDGGRGDATVGRDTGTPDGDRPESDSAAPPDSGPTPDSGPPMTGDLPSGNTGIASRYPGDEGIGGDGAVIFADDFESYVDASGLEANWNYGVYHEIRIATEADNVFAGGQSLEMTVPRQDAELSNTVARRVSPELDRLFLRYYSRFDTSFDVVGSSHNGGGISAHYYVDGNATPGIPADGRNKFLIEFECWRGEESDPNPGSLNVYIYHPEQRSMWGDHLFPDGTVLPSSSMPGDFGPDFVPRRNIVPELGRWYAYEVMLQANTPGMRDGRIALWLDGELIADFRNLRLRDV